MLHQIEEGFNVKSFFSMSKCMQQNDDSCSVGEGNQICDEDESLDNLVEEPVKKTTVHKKIFETTTVRPKNSKIQKTDEIGPSLSNDNLVEKLHYYR